jgi:hypothetical protein
VKRWLVLLRACLLLVASGVASGVAWGADCPDRFRIVFADGSRSCLTSHALAQDDVVGQFGADVRRVVPSSGYYSIAATPRLPQCRRAVGMGALLAGVPTSGLIADTAQRDAQAVQDCRIRARGATEACQCKLVLSDGRSPLTPAQFAAYADLLPATAAAASLPAATAAPPVTASATPAAAPSAAPSAAPPAASAGRATTASAPPAATAAPATSPAAAPGGVPRGEDTTASEIAALRQQLDSLRAEFSRPQPSTGTAPRKAQRARALVIGNGRYAHLGALPNPPRDAQAIAAKLRSYGIEVDLHLNVDRSALVRALADFHSRASGYDVNLLFYAGHGLQVAGINYIVPVDMQAEAASVGTVKLNSVALDDALDYLPASTRVVFLDACRDNPISRSMRSTRSAVGVGLAPVSTVSGTLLSYATRDGSTAEDGSGQNSPYTTALLRHLDAEEDIALVLRRVRQAVLQATAQRQEPWEYGSLVGEQLIVSRLAR